MDAFQGCYKDGTNGTRDCRYFAALYLLVRIAMYVGITALPASYRGGFYDLIAIVILLVFVISISKFQPYKSPSYNLIDSILLSSVIMAYVTLMFHALTASNSLGLRSPVNVILDTSLLIPLFYAVGLLLYRVLVSKRWSQTAIQKFKTLLSRCCGRVAHSVSEESLPDRLVHAEEYEQLLPEPAADEEYVWSEEDTY